MPERKNALDLTTEERHQLINGLHLLKQTPWSTGDPGVSVYDKFILVHTSAPAHEDPIFLAWHRKFIGGMEGALRKVLADDNFCLPYWDWTDHNGTMEVLLADDYMGPYIGQMTPKPVLDPDGEQVPASVDRGWFARKKPETANAGDPVPNWVSWDLPKGAPAPAFASDPVALRRHCDIPEKLPKMEDVQSVLLWEGFDGFTTALEGFPHDHIHSWVGGSMGPIATSPFDPLFFLHHANVDRLWAQWQARWGKDFDPSTSALLKDVLDQPMAPWDKDEHEKNLTDAAKATEFHQRVITVRDVLEEPAPTYHESSRWIRLGGTYAPPNSSTVLSVVHEMTVTKTQANGSTRSIDSEELFVFGRKWDGIVAYWFDRETESWNEVEVRGERPCRNADHFDDDGYASTISVHSFRSAISLVAVGQPLVKALERLHVRVGPLLLHWTFVPELERDGRGRGTATGTWHRVSRSRSKILWKWFTLPGTRLSGRRSPDWLSTVQTAVASGQLYAAMRFDDGLRIYRAENAQQHASTGQESTTGTFRLFCKTGLCRTDPLRFLPNFLTKYRKPNPNDWSRPERYSTIRLTAVGEKKGEEKLVVTANGPKGSRIWRLNVAAKTLDDLAKDKTSLPFEGWDDPTHYSTLRATALGDRIFMLGRSHEFGMLISAFNVEQLSGWSGLEKSNAFTDAEWGLSWNNDDPVVVRNASSLQVAPAGKRIAIAFLSKQGVELAFWRPDGNNPPPPTTDPSGARPFDGEGSWSNEACRRSIGLVVLDDMVHVIGMSVVAPRVGIQIWRFRD